jgi:predicted ArsR family transcriptional regulator
MTNKEKILELLKEKDLTIEDMAKTLKLTENEIRVYINRLKVKNKVKSIGKRGRYKIYSIKEPLTPEKKTKIQELLYDLSYLYNLMSNKMKLKEGIDFLPEDISILKKIKKK